MDNQVLLMLWSVLLVATIAVMVARWSVGHKEDDHLHMADPDGRLIAAQVTLAHKLDVLDRIKRILLAVTVLSGFALAAFYLYGQWLKGAGLAE